MSTGLLFFQQGDQIPTFIPVPRRSFQPTGQTFSLNFALISIAYRSLIFIPFTYPTGTGFAICT
jgi:hypothetical protein